MHRRIQKGFDVFEYYANNQWDFDNTNLLYLRSIINDIERKKYAIEDNSKYYDPYKKILQWIIRNVCVFVCIKFIIFFCTDIDLIQYFEDCIRAARLYILKESEESIPAARRHMKM